MVAKNYYNSNLFFFILYICYMIYTPRQILELDRAKKGLIGIFYEDTNGFVYEGQSDGRLLQYTKSSKTSVQTLGVIPGNNTNTALYNLSTRLESTENEVEVIKNTYATTNSLNINIQQANDNAIAYSIALGGL